MIKTVGIAVAALVAATVSTAASAATIVGSPANPTTGPGIYFNYTPNVSGIFGNNNPTVTTGPFSDTFQFSTTFDRLATIEITSTIDDPSVSFSDNVNFVFNGVRLNATVIPATSTGTSERRYLANFRIPAGVQQIFVRGSAGTAGVYAGLLSLTAVPEPSTWALMIIGFGATGGALRRRRSITATFAVA